MADGSDEQVLSEFFETATPTIEALVTRAVQQGQSVARLAIILERRFDGEVAGGCGSRSAIDARLRDVPGIDTAACRRIVLEVNLTPDNEIPAVLLVHSEGFVSVGIRRLTGRVAWLS